MQTIYQYLRSKGLASSRGIREQGVHKLTRLDIINISEELNDICIKPSVKRGRAISKHFASLTLGGSREECSYLGCRLNKLDELSRFAVMYSDRVLIRSFVSDYSESRDNDIGSLSHKFFDDLQLLWHIRPLIESGDISLTPSIGCKCQGCISKLFNIEMEKLKRLDSLSKKIANEFLDNTSLAITQLTDGKIGIKQRGPEPYFPHGFQGIELDDIPESLRKRPRILNNFLNSGEILVSRTLQKEIGAHKRMASSVVQNILYGLVAANSHGAPFVTHNPLHISCLNELAGSTEVVDRNNIAFEALTSEVPFLADVSIRNLLRLRSREKESFILYRTALNKAIDEFRSGNALTKSAAKQLYGDILAPELARMDRNVKLAARDLRTEAIRAVTGTVGAISFGICASLVNPVIIPIVAGIGTVIGLPKAASDIQKVMASGDGEKTIANEDMYFLWKTKHLKK